MPPVIQLVANWPGVGTTMMPSNGDVRHHRASLLSPLRFVGPPKPILVARDLRSDPQQQGHLHHGQTAPPHQGVHTTGIPPLLAAKSSLEHVSPPIVHGWAAGGNPAHTSNMRHPLPHVVHQRIASHLRDPRRSRTSKRGHPTATFLGVHTGLADSRLAVTKGSEEWKRRLGGVRLRFSCVARGGRRRQELIYSFSLTKLTSLQ